jgi:hypothetical protein
VCKEQKHLHSQRLQVRDLSEKNYRTEVKSKQQRKYNIYMQVLILNNAIQRKRSKHNE